MENFKWLLMLVFFSSFASAQNEPKICYQLVTSQTLEIDLGSVGLTPKEALEISKKLIYAVCIDGYHFNLPPPLLEESLIIQIPKGKKYEIAKNKLDRKKLRDPILPQEKLRNKLAMITIGISEQDILPPVIPEKFMWRVDSKLCIQTLLQTTRINNYTSRLSVIQDFNKVELVLSTHNKKQVIPWNSLNQSPESMIQSHSTCNIPDPSNHLWMLRWQQNPLQESETATAQDYYKRLICSVYRKEPITIQYGFSPPIQCIPKLEASNNNGQVKNAIILEYLPFHGLQACFEIQSPEQTFPADAWHVNNIQLGNQGDMDLSTIYNLVKGKKPITLTPPIHAKQYEPVLLAIPLSTVVPSPGETKYTIRVKVEYCHVVIEQNDLLNFAPYYSIYMKKNRIQIIDQQSKINDIEYPDEQKMEIVLVAAEVFHQMPGIYFVLRDYKGNIIDKSFRPWQTAKLKLALQDVDFVIPHDLKSYQQTLLDESNYEFFVEKDWHHFFKRTPGIDIVCHHPANFALCIEKNSQTEFIPILPTFSPHFFGHLFSPEEQEKIRNAHKIWIFKDGISISWNREQNRKTFAFGNISCYLSTSQLSTVSQSKEVHITATSAQLPLRIVHWVFFFQEPITDQYNKAWARFQSDIAQLLYSFNQGQNTHFKVYIMYYSSDTHDWTLEPCYDITWTDHKTTIESLKIISQKMKQSSIGINTTLHHPVKEIIRKLKSKMEIQPNAKHTLGIWLPILEMNAINTATTLSGDTTGAFAKIEIFSGFTSSKQQQTTVEALRFFFKSLLTD